jgi:transcriptional regulator with XRE-family HTH domain
MKYPQNGAAIRELRRRDGMSVAALAERVDCHPQSLRNIELDRRPASREILARIARELRVELAAITRDGRDSELVTAGGR